jgi:Zn-dependent protease with chaperone function
MSDYRYPSESTTFAITLLIVLAVLVISAIFTFFIAPLIVVFLLVMSYFSNKAMHGQLVRQGQHVDMRSAPDLTQVAIDCAKRVGAHGIEVYIVPNEQRNAYTFGLEKPQIVVIYSSLLRIMDVDELKFVIGHELGHVVFGHTWLNTLLGGMAGVPTSFALSMVVNLAFRSWNRACEYSADRAGLVACGNLNKVIQTLVELAAGDIKSQEQFQQAMVLLERQDNSFGNVLSESLASHPMIIKRIQELQKFAASEQYHQLQVGIR